MSSAGGSEKPLISILVPTYNRAGLLKVCLLSILEQMSEVVDKVELIVSDNASEDGTRAVAEWAMGIYPYRYHRNEENIGAGPNFLLLSNKLARGEFCWFVGDDDFVRPGALKRLIDLIEQNPDIDYFYTNMLHIETSIVESLPQPATSKDFPDHLAYDGKDHEVHRLDKWEDIIDPDRSPVFLGALQSSIFRRVLWIENSKNIGVDKDNFRTVESTFPHAIIITKAMRDRPTMYIGEPLIVVGDGSRYWMKDHPGVHIVRLLDLLHFYESMGISEKRIGKCRRGIILVFTPYLVILSLMKGNDPTIDFKGSISPFIGYKEFWLSILAFPFFRILDRIPKKSM